MLSKNTLFTILAFILVGLIGAFLTQRFADSTLWGIIGGVITLAASYIAARISNKYVG